MTVSSRCPPGRRRVRLERGRWPRNDGRHSEAGGLCCRRKKAGTPEEAPRLAVEIARGVAVNLDFKTPEVKPPHRRCTLCRLSDRCEEKSSCPGQRLQSEAAFRPLGFSGVRSSPYAFSRSCVGFSWPRVELYAFTPTVPDSPAVPRRSLNCPFSSIYKHLRAFPPKTRPGPGDTGGDTRRLLATFDAPANRPIHCVRLSPHFSPVLGKEPENRSRVGWLWVESL